MTAGRARNDAARLFLRPYEVKDAPVVLHALDESRDSLLRWAPTIGSRRTVEDVRDCLVRLAEVRTDQLIFAIWERGTNRFLGEVALYEIDRKSGVGEVGYWLRPAARGMGYMREALRILLRQTRREGTLSCMEARIPSENIASRRVVEAVGFSLVRHFAATRWWEAATANMLV